MRLSSAMQLNLGVAKRVVAAPFQIEKAERVETGAWESGRALRYTIGWFDYSATDAPAPEIEGEQGAGAGNDAPLSEFADLMRRLAVVLQPPIETMESLSGTTLEWSAPLFPYQREGVKTLLARRALLLADSMGLGKTVQAIAALRILFQREEIASALIVCPLPLMTQWRREFAYWAKELRVIPVQGDSNERGRLWQLPSHVKMVSYETLRGDVMDLRDSPALRKPWGVVVLDEASRIKNRHAALSIACKRLPRERRWILTGTPFENSIEDVASLLEFLLAEPDAPSLFLSPPEIVEQLHAHQLRRRKEDVLPELPPKTIHDIVLELPPKQREAYNRAEREGIIQLTSGAGSVTILHILELITRLKQLCNFDPASGESAKLADIRERMGEIAKEGQRALVFSQFTDSMFGIERAMDYLKAFQPLAFTGKMSASQRADTIERFRGNTKHRALLLSLKAGAQGLNLQTASYVFHLDRWWNPAIEEQADSRVHRIGQTYPVTIYRYICANTIEERIDATLKEKRKAFQEVVEDVSLDPATLTEREFFDLFGLGAEVRPQRRS